MTETETPVEPAQEAPKKGMSRRQKVLLGSGVAAVVVIGLAVFGVWWFFFRDDAPPPVSLESAVESVGEAAEASEATSDEAATEPDEAEPAEPAEAADASEESEGTAAESGEVGSLDGTWTVDTTIGSFADFTNSFVGYRVREELASIGATTAVGRTPALTGTLVLDGSAATEVTVEADMTQLQSDDSRRDGQMRTQALETDTFPTATFVLTEPIDFGEVPAEGVPVQVDATGELTVHGVTNPVVIPLEAQLTGDVIVVTGSLEVAFDDYDIAPPTSFAVLSVEDRAVIEMQLFFTQ